MGAVIVYKNLRRGDWSIATLIGDHRRGKVIDHASDITLANVRFHVEESGRARVVRNRCREVHAWCIGDIVDGAPSELAGFEVTYNPYRGATFTRRDNGAAIDRADYVTFTASHGAIAATR